jgi:hypothetical protein
MSRGKTDNLFFSSPLEMLLERWMRTKDDETLAQIAELSPPAGRADIGKAIAAKLRQKRPDKKAHDDIMWREIDRVFRWLTIEGCKTDDDAYETIRSIYFSRHGEERYDIATIKRTHFRWVKKSQT